MCGYGYGGGYGSYAGPAYQIYGGLRLKVQPRNAEVFVDGYFAGVVDDFDGAFQQLNLDVGPHRIELRAAGYESVSFEIRTQPDEKITYKARAQARPLSPIEPWPDRLESPTMGSPVGHDSKQSEKEYLRRTAGGAWERLKPFSPPGTSTLGDSTALIQDFAAALRHLPPSPDDLILDLGAGACWCSDWLQRLNLRTVAVDISEDMLRLGRTRLTGPRPWVVAGDLEQLPFASGHLRQGVLPQRHSPHPRHPARRLRSCIACCRRMAPCSSRSPASGTPTRRGR